MEITMEPSSNAFAIIKEFEGFKPTAYRDARGVWTIGWGHTRDVGAGDTCTISQAESYLASDAASAVAHITHVVTAPLTQNQFDALVSFVFNIGAGNFDQSYTLRQLNYKHYQTAADGFLHFTRAGNDRNALTGRRNKERALFLKA